MKHDPPHPATLPTLRSPNVLFIVVDDLNDWIGPLGGHPQVQTPAMDRLAERGVVFANTSCPAPICTPARCAVLSGKHPATTGLYFLEPWFRNAPVLADSVTLPQYFHQHGYHTMAVGKVFHGINDPASFDEDGGRTSSYGQAENGREDIKRNYCKGHRLWDWGPLASDDCVTPDHDITQWAIKHIGRRYDQPFFLGVGLLGPHVPLYVPPQWLQLYPPGGTIMPEAPDDPLAGVSQYARDLTYAATSPRHHRIVEMNQWENLVRCYLAAISYTDHHIGRLLNALDASPHARNTIIVLWADHGFHVGEKHRWDKRSLWEESTRVPMIIAGPGIHPGRTTQPTGTLDLYPTLIDLAGLPKRHDLDGDSLLPLLRNPVGPWRPATVCTFGPGNHAVRSQRWRYIRYADGSHELYDHDTDPGEWHNLADDPAHVFTLTEHLQWLPDTDAPLAPNSAGVDSPLFL